MGFLTRLRKQYAVYWAPLADTQYGRAAFAEPIEIRCRWDDSAEEFLTPGGERIISQAVVIVDQVVEPGGFLWEGQLANLDSLVHTANERALAIQRFEKTPDIKNREGKTLYTAYL